MHRYSRPPPPPPAPPSGREHGPHLRHRPARPPAPPSGREYGRHLRRRPATPPAPPPPSTRSWPAALERDLRGPYSIRLYGSSGVLDLDTVRVIWPALLSEPARAWLCEHRAELRIKPPLLANDALAGPMLNLDPGITMQAAALWVHGAERRGRAAVPDGTWVEAAHCNVPHAKSFMWSKVAPGTGVWINVGRSLAVNFTGGNPLLRELMNWTRPEDPVHALRKSLATSAAHAAISLHGALGERYDSVQFVDFMHPPDASSHFLIHTCCHESETISTYLNRLRCGPAASRACNASEAAMVQQQACRAPRESLPVMKELHNGRADCSVLREDTATQAALGQAELVASLQGEVAALRALVGTLAEKAGVPNVTALLPRG